MTGGPAGCLGGPTIGPLMPPGGSPIGLLIFPLKEGGGGPFGRLGGPTTGFPCGYLLAGCSNIRSTLNLVGF